MIKDKAIASPKDAALKLTLEALESGVDTQIGRLAWTAYDSCLINEAIIAIKEALAPTSTQCEVQSEQSWSWVCNECGAREFTSAVLEADLEYLACAGCGCSDFHKEALAQPDYLAVKTYHEGKPVYVSQPEQELEYCVDYHCAGDCGQPHNQQERQAFLVAQPLQRPWVGLTDEEASWCQAPSTIQTWKRIEAILKEKNT